MPCSLRPGAATHHSLPGLACHTPQLPIRCTGKLKLCVARSAKTLKRLHGTSLSNPYLLDTVGRDPVPPYLLATEGRDPFHCSMTKYFDMSHLVALQGMIFCAQQSIIVGFAGNYQRCNHIELSIRGRQLSNYLPPDLRALTMLGPAWRMEDPIHRLHQLDLTSLHSYACSMSYSACQNEIV